MQWSVLVWSFRKNQERKSIATLSLTTRSPDAPHEFFESWERGGGRPSNEPVWNKPEEERGFRGDTYTLQGGGNHRNEFERSIFIAKYMVDFNSNVGKDPPHQIWKWNQPSSKATNFLSNSCHKSCKIPKNTEEILKTTRNIVTEIFKLYVKNGQISNYQFYHKFCWP